MLKTWLIGKVDRDQCMSFVANVFVIGLIVALATLIILYILKSIHIVQDEPLKIGMLVCFLTVGMLAIAITGAAFFLDFLLGKIYGPPESHKVP